MTSLRVFSSSSSPTRRRTLGQGMTEYLIIVALIAVAAIATFAFFGRTVREQMAGLSTEVAGKSAATQITQAQAAATSANTAAKEPLQKSSH